VLKIAIVEGQAVDFPQTFPALIQARLDCSKTNLHREARCHDCKLQQFGDRVAAFCLSTAQVSCVYFVKLCLGDLPHGITLLHSWEW
jgi:hypothetical protein